MYPNRTIRIIHPRTNSPVSLSLLRSSPTTVRLCLGFVRGRQDSGLRRPSAAVGALFVPHGRCQSALHIWHASEPPQPRHQRVRRQGRRFVAASSTFAGERLASVYPFPRPHSCGSLRHYSLGPGGVLDMSFRKRQPSSNGASINLAPLGFPSQELEKVNPVNSVMSTDFESMDGVDIDMREVYFLIMHFLSHGPFKRTFGELCNELLEHQLLPRRYHAWYSRGGFHSGEENDDGISLPLDYVKLAERVSPNAADVPTLLGSNSFSLLPSDRQDKGTPRLPSYLRWPHIQTDQVHGLSLREIGGFTKHCRAPSVRASCYAIAKPSTLVEKMQIIKRLRGHQNAVYCATFDRTGRYVITGSDDRLVKIWAMETAFCLASCRGHEGDITDLAVSSNNSVVASSSNDFIIRVWRMPDGMPVSVLKGHTGAVTAIAFSPRPGAAFQLLSSSDDGTCRIWDARYSQQPPRLYTPKPPDVAPGKSGDASSSAAQVQPTNHQILCCAFNANGTVFVTGSSDTYARVCFFFLPSHVNFYCNFGKLPFVIKKVHFRFTHNIVTCSRDGSAIIWVPRSRRSHGKIGRWTRAYHLKVPPPPMAPQPPRGGPRQRYQPTPRGVNMIVWSLDNRFVLAAIMDCRICVWNASDGSLVHSLIGHKESTFVLDVHPFNPRIAMSAGYDGKTIIWDIWEGKPVQIYETGQFKLVDGKFSPDGTSLILSDEVGRVFIIGTGQGESQKDAKYDQFFLGDYRPLIRDTNGSVIDQETQLAPYRRNMQDLLCDAGMIPYPEPFQSMYQKRRLGTLGLEWRPPSVNFAVGPTYNATTGEYQTIPIIDPDRWEPLPEITDFIELEPENEVISDDTDSEYNGMDEYSSEGEQDIMSGDSSGTSYSSGEIDADNPDSAHLRRSRRKKKKSEADLVTSSGRRVIRKRFLDDPGVATVSRPHRGRKSRNGCSSKKKRSPKSRGLRPRRRAAETALITFPKKGVSTEEDEDDSESFSDSELNTDSTEAEQLEWSGQLRTRREINSPFDIDDVTDPSQFTDNKENSGTGKKLVLRIPRRDLRTQFPLGSGKAECSIQDKAVKSLSLANHEPVEHELTIEPGHSPASKAELTIDGDLHDSSAVCSNNSIRWGEVKMRSSKRCKYSEPAGGLWSSSNNVALQDIEGSSSQQIPHEYGDGIQPSVVQNVQEVQHGTILDNIPENNSTDEHTRENFGDLEKIANNINAHADGVNDTVQVPNTSQPQLKVKFKSRGSADAVGNIMNSKHVKDSVQCGDDSSINQPRNADFYIVPKSSQECLDKSTSLHDSKKPYLDASKKYTAVYKRSKRKNKKKMDSDECPNEDSTSISNDDGGYQPAEYSPVAAASSRLRRSARKSFAYNINGTTQDDISEVKVSYGSHEASTSGRRVVTDVREGMWRQNSRSVGLRSARNKRESNSFLDTHPLGRRHQVSFKYSWLMLLEHEDSYRYIPQLDDEVMYLGQGHEEYLKQVQSSEFCPWNRIKGLKAVELCKIQGLDYATYRGSGESCCKLTIEFVDCTSSGFGKTFMITLRELVNFPDFLVERTRYEAAMERNWTHRDKCKVWWRDEEGQVGGTWWEGRVMAVTPKSPDFPESPWEKYVIQYKEDGSDHAHSPWELHETGSLWDPWKHPHMDLTVRDKLLSEMENLQEMSHRDQDHYGVLKLDKVAEKSDFINRFPVQFSIEVIKARLANKYYRTLGAVRHDTTVMLSNAESYFSKSSEMTKKIRKLSELLDQIFSSL
ncbi:Bromodomain and WD repeat-containing protein 1 [Zea mays]|uniref:Bromodomain and WD repeat-containing protein 1 n=3 Tax=Zea mays TaxID=4577 RepID=A0A3L6DNI1_MAIZE|nr:Bromodomain and WD repeat-containing protein 1 [Zea mays]